MARKRLSNLNSEEAKKSPDSKSITPTSDTDSPAAPKQPVPSAKKTNIEDQNSTQLQPAKGKATDSTQKAEPVEIVDPGEISNPVKTAAPVEAVEAIDAVEVPDVVEVAESAETIDSSVQPDRTQEALEATIAELNATKATLETVCQTARHRETEFRAQVEQLQTDLQEKQGQVEQLQTDLQEKQALIDQLQAELKQSSQLKTELEDARKMILQLSQVNAKPAASASSSSSQAARTESTSPSPKREHLPQSQPSQSQPSQSQLSQSQPSVPPQRSDRSLSPIALQRQPASPARQNPFAISPEEKLPEKLPAQDSRLSDSDMGWVD